MEQAEILWRESGFGSEPTTSDLRDVCLGRLWGLPGAGQLLHACISDPHTDPCMRPCMNLIQSDLLTETAEFSHCMHAACSRVSEAMKQPPAGTHSCAHVCGGGRLAASASAWRPGCSWLPRSEGLGRRRQGQPRHQRHRQPLKRCFKGRVAVCLAWGSLIPSCRCAAGQNGRVARQNMGHATAE
jgi:hypothetical protein